MFEVNDDLDMDDDFFDQVFEDEKTSELKKSSTEITKHDFKPIQNQQVLKILNNSDVKTNNQQNNHGKKVESFPASNRITPTRNRTLAPISTKSITKRQRKFPGPAGLLPERNSSTSFNSALDIHLEDSTDGAEKDLLCSQGTLSGSVIEDEPWQSFLSDLGSQQEVLTVINISSVKKKANTRVLLRRKVPFLAAVLHSIDASGPDPCIILRDTTGEINGTLHRNVWEEFGSDLKPGCVMVLRNIGVFSTGSTSRRHYVNITGNNLVTLYPPNKGKIQVSQNFNVTNLHFLRFIEDWRESAKTLISPINTQTPKVLSLFNNSAPSLLARPNLNSPSIPKSALNRQNIGTPLQFSNVNGSNYKSQIGLNMLGQKSVTSIQKQNVNVKLDPINKPYTKPVPNSNFKYNNNSFSTSNFKSDTFQRKKPKLCGNNENSSVIGASQNTLVHTQDLGDDERSVVENVFDGIDSSDLFDDF